MPAERRYGFAKPAMSRLFGALDAAGSVLAAPFRRRAPWPPPRRILLVNLAHIGDVLLTTPAIAALRAAHPHAHLALLVSPWSADVARGNPRLDEILPYRPSWWDRARGSPYLVPREYADFVRLLRAGRYDLVINFKSFVQENLAAALAGIPRRIGYGLFGGGFLHTDCLIFPWQAHTAEQHLRLARAAGAAPEAAPPVRVFPGPDEMRAAEGMEGISVAFHLGAGTPAKRWPLERFAALGDRLAADHGARIVLVGGPEDTPLAQAYQARAGRPADVVAGRLKLLETAAVLQRCAAFVGNDSGPAHLAAAVGTPVIAIFSGVNEPEQWKPWGPGVTVLQRRPPCAPCGRATCHLDHACMNDITVDEVYGHVSAILGRAQA